MEKKIEKNEEKVSVVMCTYNGEKYIKEQIDSILNQTYPIYEFIIQDDCSTDSTYDIINDYSKKFSIIKIFRNKQQRGYNENFFSALNRATGDYIALSDQDDIWENNKLVELINDIGDSYLCFSRNQTFSEDGVSVVPLDLRIPNFGIERIIFQGPTAGHALLIKKELIGLVPDRKNYNHEYDQILQMVAAAYNRISFCDKVLVRHRRYLNAATYSSFNKDEYQRTFLNYLLSAYRHLKMYCKKRSVMRKYFYKTHSFLIQIPQNYRLQNALKLCEYQSKGSVLSYIKLTFLCIKLRNEILFSIETKKLISILRAVTFPIYCSEYFKSNQKNF